MNLFYYYFVNDHIYVAENYKKSMAFETRTIS